MKKLFIKLMCLLLVFSMVAVIFIGCDDDADNKDNTENNENTDENNDNSANNDNNNTEYGNEDDWTADDKVGEVADTTIDAPRVLVVTDFHYAADTQRVFYGIDKDVRMANMIRDINAEHAKDPLEAIFFSGDSSLDHWVSGGSVLTGKHGNVSYTRTFIQKYKAQLPAGVPTYFAAGNHEQFTNEEWKSITGNERNTYAVHGNYLFLVWDAFGADLGSNKNHDGTPTPINSVWAKSVMDQYPDKKVILISHWANSNSSDVIDNDRVVALFVGHNHLSTKGSVCGKPMIYCGNYSYSGENDPRNSMWGFRDIYLFSDKLLTRYIVPDNTSFPTGPAYTSTYHYQDIYEFNV